MVARKFQSYTFKRSVDFVNTVDVVDAVEEAVQGAAAAWEENGGARKSAAAEDLAMSLSGN